MQKTPDVVRCRGVDPLRGLQTVEADVRGEDYVRPRQQPLVPEHAPDLSNPLRGLLQGRERQMPIGNPMRRIWI